MHEKFFGNAGSLENADNSQESSSEIPENTGCFFRKM